MLGNVVFNLIYFFVDFGTLNFVALIGSADTLASSYVDQVVRMTGILFIELLFYGYVIADRQKTDYYLADLLKSLYAILGVGVILWLIIGGIGAGIFSLIQWSLQPFDVFLQVLGYLLLGLLVISALELIVLAFELVSSSSF